MTAHSKYFPTPTPEERRTKQRLQRARRMARSDEEIAAARRAKWPDGLKRCNKCGRSKPFNAFTESAREVDGLWSHCLACHPVGQS